MVAMPSPRSFVARRLDDVIVYVHDERSPTDEEWEQALSHYREAPDPTLVRALVLTAGGAPNAKQRSRLNQVAGTSCAIAVLTPSPIARAAGVAVAWFNPRVRIFGRSEVEEALDHLAVSSERRPVLRRLLAELERELGRPAARS